MALQTLSLRSRPLTVRCSISMDPLQTHLLRQYASTASETPSVTWKAKAPPPTKLRPDPTFSSHAHPGPTSSQIASYDPIKRSRARKKLLPPSRYNFRPPKYYRGPLHPHQPPSQADPASRLFAAGPFSLPRLQQTYTSTLRSDLMTLAYQHTPPGTVKIPTPQRLRAWNPDDSPYNANRPLRAPRGRPTLPLLRKQITFRNVPALSKITISSLVTQAVDNSAYLHVAGMALQAISGVRATVYMARKSFTAGHRTPHTQRAGKPIAIGVTLEREDMWHFLSTLIDRVLPRVKDWKGIRGSSGDGSGNLGLGLAPDVVGGWPELEINYDAYPPQMIPGIDIVIHTTATNDRDARLLLSSFGLPFDGKHWAKA